LRLLVHDRGKVENKLGALFYLFDAFVQGIESIPNRGKPSLEYHLSAQVGPFIDVEYAIGIAFELLKRTPADQGEDCR
jgi:hypothetical protein